MKRITNFILNGFLILFIIMTFTLYVPHIVGIQTFKVLSGSMQPNYPVGSLVYVKKTQPDTINIGDVITFYINENSLVTHRVVDKDIDKRTFETKGDANEVKDGGKVSFDNVVGKAIFCIPYLGYVSSYFNTTQGSYLLVGFIAILFVATFLPDILRKSKLSKECE